MTSESTRVVLHLDRDPHLVSVIRKAVEFQATHAGLAVVKCGEFAKASEDVCREALSHLTDGDEGIEVTLDTFADRIEISIAHHGALLPAIGLEKFAVPEAFGGETSGLSGKQLLERVDRVLFSTEGSVARTTLVKFLHPKH